jgi:hypothetical protein
MWLFSLHMTFKKVLCRTHVSKSSIHMKDLYFWQLRWLRYKSSEVLRRVDQYELFGGVWCLINVRSFVPVDAMKTWPSSVTLVVLTFSWYNGSKFPLALHLQYVCWHSSYRFCQPCMAWRQTKDTFLQTLFLVDFNIITSALSSRCVI